MPQGRSGGAMITRGSTRREDGGEDAGEDAGWASVALLVEGLRHQLSAEWETKFQSLQGELSVMRDTALEDAAVQARRATLAEERALRLEVELKELRRAIGEGGWNIAQTGAGEELGEVRGSQGERRWSFAEVLAGDQKAKEVIREVTRDMVRTDKGIWRERQWEEERERSLMIHGLREAEGSPQIRWEDEEENNILSVIGCVGREEVLGQIENFQRIGGFSRGRLRPVKVTFQSPLARNKILRQKARLRYTEYSRVYLDRDRTRMEREHLKERLRRRHALGHIAVEEGGGGSPQPQGVPPAPGGTTASPSQVLDLPIHSPPSTNPFRLPHPLH